MLSSESYVSQEKNGKKRIILAINIDVFSIHPML